ncbi:hypothetical protein B0O99DRAFT_693688 [Bisporella sp. PMI_857]|nr:hypothetical protein B0O99DRAFT_693688 [Bisporella sp. PMI_857]
MLRARFVQSESGDWSQLITSNIDNSYQLSYHKNADYEYIERAVIKSQGSLDIRNGPLFSADVFEDVLMHRNGRQLIFITAHHLAVDLVSKRIILQDLEDILKSGVTRHHQSLPFQSWLSLQRQRAQSFLAKKTLRTSIPLSNYAYWGMESRSNLVSDIKIATITIAADKTAKLLGAANNALNTEPLDLLLASTIHAFAQTFNDRDLPAIFNEGNGRDTWDSAIDISRTVGCFTVVSPLVVEASSDTISTIRAIKDARRRSSQEGICSFSSSLFDETDHGSFQAYEKMELVFNYSDQEQQLEQADSLISQSGLDLDLHDWSPGMERSGLFRIDATLENSTLKIAFKYNRHMQQEARIPKFFSKCQQVLEEISDCLPQQGRQFTETDFPLLNMEPAHLITLTELLSQLNLTSPEEIEDIYPCSPMQEGILASQAKDASHYLMNNMFEIKCRLEDTSVDASRYVAAWHAVVHRHSALRTIFVPSISDDKSMFQQLVLKHVIPKVFFVTGSSDEEGLANLTDHVRLDTTQLVPGHQLGIFESLDTGSLFLRLEINHAIADAYSTELILNELSQAYDNQLSISGGPLYSDYIAYLSKQSKVDALEYWTKYLEGATPSLLSSVNCGPEERSEMQSINVQIPNAELVHNFGAQHSVTVANILQSVWALVLQCYTGQNSVSFGYISSGRDLPISNISECIGPLINFLTCRIEIDSSASVLDLLRRIQGDHSVHLSHRAISMAEVQHALGLGSERLFNTGFSVQKISDEDLHGTLTYKHLDSQNPSEFDFVMNTTYSRTAIEAMISYQGNLISEAHARNIHDTFNQVLTSILHSADKPISEVEKVGVFNKQQLFKWNGGVIPEIPDLIHDRFQAEVATHPNSEAVCAWDGSLTYLELDQLSTELSLHLKKIGVTTEKLVPFCFEKSVWTIVAVLAIIKAGGACVPLEPTHPRSRKEVMVKTVGAQLILCSHNYAAECATLVDDIFVVNQATIQALPTADYMELQDAPGVVVRPENSVYIVFTSGSTGQPKGVVWAHANLSSSITYHGAMYEMSRQTRIFQFASHVFDASAFEILTTLLHGGCVCIPSDQDKLASFTTYVNSQNVNTAFLTATFARQVDPNLVPSLKKLILGGEPVGQDNASKWSSKLTLINGWGTTETTIACSAGVIKPTSSNINSIGSPFGSHFWITDPEDIQKLLPIGAVGELLVEGPILARGYLNDPEKTKKSFISVQAGPNLRTPLPRDAGTVLEIWQNMNQTVQ